MTLKQIAYEIHQANQLKAFEMYLLYGEKLTDEESVSKLAMVNMIYDIAYAHEVKPFEKYYNEVLDIRKQIDHIQKNKIAAGMV